MAGASRLLPAPRIECLAASWRSANVAELGVTPQEAATTAEGQSAGTITLPHGEIHEATSLPPFASRPPSATEPFHEIQSAEQHDDQG